MQIPLASADVERSQARDREEPEHQNLSNGDTSLPNLATPAWTREERLLADLLAADAHLLEALHLYEDLWCLRLEREPWDPSRRLSTDATYHLNSVAACV